MGTEYGVLINGKHTGTDYHLKWMAPFTIESPKVKRQTMDVPFGNGILDLTAFITGDDAKYDNREMKFRFEREGNYTRWDIDTMKIKNDLHGRLCPIIPDTRPDWVYYGMVEVQTEKEILDTPYDVVITVDADPYKYERYSSLERWVWDTFCFEDGIIRDYKDLEVNGSMTLLIPGRRKKVVPVLDCTVAMTLEYGGRTYHLPAGRSKLLDLRLGEGEHFLTFHGNGKVSVDYRGASL